METRRLPTLPDTLAPDGSEIRLLAAIAGHGSAVHCTLPAGQTSLAVVHRTVTEIWYFLGGEGQVWRKEGTREAVADVAAGVCLTIPTGVHFQFRVLGDEPLTFLCLTMPPWPGAEEAARVPDHWPDGQDVALKGQEWTVDARRRARNEKG